MKINNTWFAALLALACLPLATARAAQPELNIYNWVDYLPPQVLKDFQAQTGIKVNYDVFDSPHTLEAKVLTGTSGYDLVFPNSVQVAKFIQAGAIQKLDRAQLPNWQHLDPGIMHNLERVDPANQYAVPYLWGTTLIGYNADKVRQALGADAKLDSWDLVFKEKNISKLQGCGVAMIDAPEELLPIALHYLGLDPSSGNPEDYRKAEALLLKVRPHIRYFNSAKLASDLANGDVCVVVAWSAAVLQAQGMAAGAKNGNDIRMLLPREGTLMWADTMAIPKGAKHAAEAQKFIDYLLLPKVIAQVSNLIGYPNPNRDSTAEINPELLKNQAMFIPQDQRGNLFTLAPVPMRIERDMTRSWTRIKSGT